MTSWGVLIISVGFDDAAAAADRAGLTRWESVSVPHRQTWDHLRSFDAWFERLIITDRATRDPDLAELMPHVQRVVIGRIDRPANGWTWLYGPGAEAGDPAA